MRRRHLIPSAVLVTVSGLGARGYFSHADAFLSTKSADSDVSSALTDKQDKAHFDFKSAGILTTGGAAGLVSSSTKLNRE